jgi:hypothetical protein
MGHKKRIMQKITVVTLKSPCQHNRLTFPLKLQHTSRGCGQTHMTIMKAFICNPV